MCKASQPAELLPQLTRGMNGALLLTGGEACPAVVPAPFDLGPDLSTNAVVAAGFRLPPHQLHVPRCPAPCRATAVMCRAHTMMTGFPPRHTACSSRNSLGNVQLLVS